MAPKTAVFFCLQVLKDYQIIVIGTEQLNTVVYKGPAKSKKIILLHHDAHFDVIKSLPAFFERSHWCFLCDKGYNSLQKHRCAVICKGCVKPDCNPGNDAVSCRSCRRTFPSLDCYARHKLGPEPGPVHSRRSLCSTLYICQMCHALVSPRNRKADNHHKCGESFCKQCGLFDVTASHKCFMEIVSTTKEDLKKSSDARFLFFDFETYVDSSGELVPNLAVVQDDDEGNEWIFPEVKDQLGFDVTQPLCQFLFQAKHKNYYVLAHNFKVCFFHSLRFTYSLVL